MSYAEFGNGWRCACGHGNARTFDTCGECGRGRSAEAQAPDPRVKHGDGPHPNIAAVTALAVNVHERLDAVGVPRVIPEGTLTLLGRMDVALTMAEEAAKA